MGSIPLPALDIRPAPSPLETYGRLVELKSLMGQQQLQQSELASQAQARQLQQQQLQMGQIQLNDIDAFHKAYANSEGDLDKMFELAPRYGASPQAMLQLRQTITNTKKGLVDLDDATLKDQQTKNSMLAGRLQSVLQLPPERQTEEWSKAVQELAGNGMLTPQQARQFAGFPGAQRAQMMLNGLMTQQQLLDEARKEKAAGAELPGQTAESLTKTLGAVGQTLAGAQNQQQWAARYNFLRQQGVDPDLLALIPEQFSPQAAEAARGLAISPDKLLSSGVLESRYIGIVQRMNQGQAVAPADAAFRRAFEKYKTLIPQFNLNMQMGSMGFGAAPAPAPAPGAAPAPAPGAKPGAKPAAAPPNALTGAAYLNTIRDPGLRARIQAIDEGRESISTGGFASRSPAMLALMRAVYQYDPAWNAQRAQLVNKYTTDRGNTISAINTALGHAGMLGDAVQALNNGDVRVLNHVANSVGVEVGQTPVTTFRTIVNRLAPELIRAYNDQASEGEKRVVSDDFDPNLSPQQLAANVGVTVDLLRSKIGSLENQWNQVFNGKPPISFGDRFIMPQAAAAVARWGTAQDAVAAGPHPPSYYPYSATAPNGHKIGYDPQKNAWVDMRTGKPQQ